jgi:hypothetical protein
MERTMGGADGEEFKPGLDAKGRSVASTSEHSCEESGLDGGNKNPPVGKEVASMGAPVQFRGITKETKLQANSCVSLFISLT